MNATPSQPRSRLRDLAQEEIDQIKHLANQGYGTRRIAERLGISRKIVRNITAKPHQNVLSGKLDPYREAIQQRVTQHLTTSRILREIRELGYTGGRTILAEQVRQLKSLLPHESRR